MAQTEPDGQEIQGTEGEASSFSTWRQGMRWGHESVTHTAEARDGVYTAIKFYSLHMMLRRGMIFSIQESVH